MKPVSILAVALPDDDRRMLDQIAARLGWNLCATPTSAEVVLFNRDLPQETWRDALPAIVDAAPNASVILLSPVNDDYLWEEVVKRGGYDVVVRPLREDRLVHAVTLACSYARFQKKL